MTTGKRVSRIMIAAPRSGSGKTVITCGLLGLLRDEGCDVTSFKCGPDYIDPMFHKKVLGIYGGNLDTYFCSHDKVKELLASCGHSMAVVEAVMGLYDGVGGLSLEGSGYDIARATATPIVLVVDGKGAGRTIASTIKGILSDDTDHLIKGIILNRVTDGFYQRLKPVIEKELETGGYEIELLGAIPELKDSSIDSRHLGLFTPDEIDDIKDRIAAVSGALRQHVEVEKLLSIMEKAADLSVTENDPTPPSPGSISGAKQINLAVAMDEAFCFYYRENLQLFERLGVNLKYFSPVHDSELPKDIQGIYIGGGYPELHLKELSENVSMRKAIRDALSKGLPSIAECGGFMYLHERIFSSEEEGFEMAGVILGDCHRAEHLVRFGYVQLKCDGNEALSGIKGHEFHYYDSTSNGEDALAVKAGDDRSWKAMYVSKTHVWGFPHLYFESKPEFAEAFVEAMKNVR